MKSIFTCLFLSFCLYSSFSQTVLLFDDFESYVQGSISSQNGGWTDLSNVQANVEWQGGTFVDCSGSDANQAYLSFISNDDITAQVGLNANNGQVTVEVNATMILGYQIRFFGNDIFYSDSYNDATGDFSLMYVINFETDEVSKYVDDIFINSTPIQSNLNSLFNIEFSNSFGSFKLGCLTVTDVTDNDGDGYYATNDCNDNNAAINPGANETPYDGIDNDCNPTTLDDDLDIDGYVLANDCNDDNAAINPGANETPYDGIDNDCNPATLDDDLDIDGYVLANDCNDNNAAIHPGASETPYDGLDNDCNPATLDDDLDSDGYVQANDCNDNNAAINPGANETPYDGVDNDCNPATLDDDLDSDGYVQANDCNDDNAAINPGANETPYDGIDNDCNPTTLDDDLDSDGYLLVNDCNDNDPDINPAAEEILENNIDENCDGILGTTASKNVSDSNAIILPNPAIDVIEIRNNLLNSQFSIFDFHGREVIKTKNNIIDISHLLSGLYCISISKGNIVVNKTFIKL